jgi:hypothetical protein
VNKFETSWVHRQKLDNCTFHLSHDSDLQGKLSKPNFAKFTIDYVGFINRKIKTDPIINLITSHLMDFGFNWLRPDSIMLSFNKSLLHQKG